MKLIKKIIWKLNKLKRGDIVTIRPIDRCNLSCDYCIAVIDGRDIKSKEPVLSVQEWMEILDQEKHRIVQITGGEPMLYPHIRELVKELIKKYHVRIFSNLTIYRDLPKSSKIRFHATYHRSASLRKFLINLDRYRKKYLVGVWEIETKFVSGSHWKKEKKSQEEMQCSAEYSYNSKGKKVYMACHVDKELNK